MALLKKFLTQMFFLGLCLKINLLIGQTPGAVSSADLWFICNGEKNYSYSIGIHSACRAVDFINFDSLVNWGQRGVWFIVYTDRESSSQGALIRIKDYLVFRDSIKGFMPHHDMPVKPEKLLVLSITRRTEHQGKLREELEILDSNVLISEIIYYDRFLSLNEIESVESYLAMKYSINITRRRSGEHRDYKTLTRLYKFWNGETDNRFDSDVLCVGRDTQVNIDQLITRSNEPGRLHLRIEPEEQAVFEGIVVMSRRDKEMRYSGLKGRCLEQLKEQADLGELLNWKLRGFGIEAKGLNLYLSFDTNHEGGYKSGFVVLTDFSDTFHVEGVQGGYRLHVSKLKNETDYFFVLSSGFTKYCLEEVTDVASTATGIDTTETYLVVSRKNGDPRISFTLSPEILVVN